ncbi:MAG: hypothetical protein JXR49_19375 [Acidobacteria bacterium]|nr:hypothetical protein [Acidobacteriota bacterium]
MAETDRDISPELQGRIREYRAEMLKIDAYNRAVRRRRQINESLWDFLEKQSDPLWRYRP